MIRLLFTLAPALVAAGVGIFAQTADTPEGYVSGLRALFQSSFALAWIAVVIYVWRKYDSLLQRVALSVLLLAVLRVLYMPLLDLGLLGAAWTGRLAANAGVADRGMLVHAAFGFWLALLAGPLCMLVVAAVTKPFMLAAKIGIAVLVLLGIVAFLAPGDRHVLPQGFEGFDASERSAPIAEPDPEQDDAQFKDVLVRRGERFSTRVVAFAGLLVEFALPREGWGGTVRDALAERCADQAPDSWRGYVEDLEYAFVEARPMLVDAP